MSHMKINFSKFIGRSKEAAVPAAKFSGQRYGIGNSAFYDEDEDVHMIKPSKPEQFDVMDDHDDELVKKVEDREELNDHALAVVVNMLDAVCCDDEICKKIAHWIETCDCLNPSDRDYLMDVLDSHSDDFNDMDDFEEMDDSDEYEDSEDEWSMSDDNTPEKKNF